MWLLTQAAWQDTQVMNCRGQIVDLKKGQLLVSLRALGDKWLWSTKKVKAFLDQVETHLGINRDQKGNGETLVTVLNYGNFGINKETQKKRRRNGEETDTIDITNNQLTNIPLSPSETSPTGEQMPLLPCRFEEFWSIYPVKKARKKVLAIWKRKKLDDKADFIIERVKTFAGTRAWMDGYVPNPSTFLTQERWDDDIASYEAQSSTSPNRPSASRPVSVNIERTEGDMKWP